jgi:hypothetical protein
LRIFIVRNSSNHKMNLAPSTWQALGLSVAASYASLGMFAIVLPHRAAYEFFGLSEPVTPATPKRNDGSTITLLMRLLGARDISIALALSALGYTGRWRELGTVILAGSILCAADCVAIWRAKGPGL